MKKNLMIAVLLCAISAALYLTFKNDNPTPEPDATTGATSETTETPNETEEEVPTFPHIAIVENMLGELKDGDGEKVLLTYQIDKVQVTEPASEGALEHINAYYENIYSKNLDFVNFEGADTAASEYSRLGENFLEHMHTFRVASIYEDEYLLSVSREKLFYNGGASGVVEQLYSETFKKEDGSLVLLTDIITDTSVITEIVKDFVKGDASFYYENYEELITEHFDANRYYLDGEYLYIYYDTYELGPASAGALRLGVEFTALKDALTDEYKYLGE